MVDTFAPGPHFVHWLVQSIAMLATAFLLPGLRVSGPIPAFLTVVVLAYINAHIWDTALFFQVPNTLSYQMLVLLLTNGLIFWFVVKILPGISIEGVVAPIIAPIIFSLLSVGIGHLEKRVDWPSVLNTSKETIKEVKDYVK